MKPLYHIIEGILDVDFDVNIITLEELIDTVYTGRMTKKQWTELMQSIDTSFEPADSSDIAQDYFGTIEVFQDERKIDIRFMPINERARGFGSRRDLLEVKKGKIKRGGDRCHWLFKPAYQIPETNDNRFLLNELYETHK